MMKDSIIRNYFPDRLAVVLLASAIGIPAVQAQTATEPQSAPAQQNQTSNSTYVHPAQEGFWGKVNPFARKKWVKKQTDPINDRLSELDQVNAKNGRDIQDVDGRAQAGIRKAQGTADAANQAANAAGAQAQNANGMAQGATGRVDKLNATVGGLDNYRQTSELTVIFRPGSVLLNAAARKQLDDLAAGLGGKQGYIVEIEAHAPQAGAAGIQTSERVAEAVKRYLVTEHQIPVYRLHAVALGNAEQASTGSDTKPARTPCAHLRLMENSLAAQAAAPPQGTAVVGSAERP
jgi:outer membrane protein OmpA-like peptidoglycan-associated protein